MLLSSVIPAVLGLLASTVCAADFPTLEIAGNKFFYSNNGSQFYIKGVAYQANTANTTSTSFVDPLADSDTCDRDIPYLAELGTNVVRVYAVNASLDHDHCMQKLQDHGIYVIADLSQPKESIISSDPSWDLTLFKRYTEVVDMFAKYDNVLGFFAGNEVVTQSNDTNSAPFIKAAIRDMKAYIADNYDRTIPVGYSANDDEDTRVFSADYFACGDEDESADFYGINMYEWCGKSSFATSGYKDRTEEFSNLTIPIFFSEYGCNAVQPRQFTEVQALYSDKMTDVWSGGIVYMYFQEENDYGLVSVSGDSVSTLSDFNNLKTQLASVSPTSATYSQVSATATAMSCPTANKMWRAVTDLPPTPDQGACDCLWDSLECIISDDVDEEDYGDLFGYVCSDMDCSGISKNGTTGDYGAFSFCSPKEMLSFVLNQYYEENGSKSSACDFSGSASVKSSSGASSCKSVLAAASTATGGATHVTKISGNTAGASSGSGSGSSSKSSSKSGSSSTSSSTASSAATPSMARPFLNLQDFGMIALFTTFFVGGVSYIFV